MKKEYVIKSTTYDIADKKQENPFISYYGGYSHHGINTSFFKELGFNVSPIMVHHVKLEEAKRFKTKKQAKEEMQKANINYYNDTRYEIIEIEG